LPRQFGIVVEAAACNVIGEIHEYCRWHNLKTFAYAIWNCGGWCNT